MGETEARGWLLLKIAECMGEEPSDRMADRLATYNGAYQAICQWEGQRPRTSNLQSNKSFTLADAEDWTSRMVNADGTKDRTGLWSKLNRSWPKETYLETRRNFGLQ